MPYKQVYKYSEIEDKILKAVDIISDPIRETMSPKGRNVLFENDKGSVISTNDGATLAKSISVSEPVVNAIIEVIKGSSLKTNTEVGDGTSTTILLSSILIKEGLRLVKDGVNAMDIKKELTLFGENLKNELKNKAIQIKTKEDRLSIATISANNDMEVAKDTVKAIDVAGLDGMIFIEPNNKVETEVIEDTGFHIETGMFVPELRTEPNRFVATYMNVPVLITDKRIYYKEEVQSILGTVLDAGYKEVVIIARDFIGESLNEFLVNHNRNVVRCLLIKDPRADGKNNESLDDLAVYLNGKVVSEKNGSIVNKLNIKDFVMANKVFADGSKTLITPKVTNTKNLKLRVEALKKELEKDKDNDTLKRRISSLTNGMVTIKVGGNTPIEIHEKIFRFEDAINALRAAIKDGYLVGGGISIYRAYQALIKKPVRPEFNTMFKKYCEGNIRQIADNCGKHAESIIGEISVAKPTVGYNALTDKVEDLLKAGVIDPYKVTEMAISNSISVANQILSSGYLIINEVEKDNE